MSETLADPLKEAYAQGLEDAAAELRAWARDVAAYTNLNQVAGVEESARIIARRAVTFRRAAFGGELAGTVPQLWETNSV